MSKIPSRKFSLYDTLHVLNKEHSLFGGTDPVTKPMANNTIEHRYEEINEDFTVRSWLSNGREKTVKGTVDIRPPWLERIITIAVVGDHIQIVTNLPPHAILWFITDTDRNLIEFTDFTN